MSPLRGHSSGSRTPLAMTSHSIDPPDELDLFGAVHRKAAQQAAVAELGRRALTGAQPEALLNEAVSSAQEALGTERVAVLHPDAPGALVCVASGGWTPEEIGANMLSDTSQVGDTFL